MLLEELKNVSTQEPRGRISEHHRILDNPLEDYQREEMRLKNTQSPFVDELRIANKKLQKAMNEGTYKPNYNNNSTKQKWQQPARSISANPGMFNLFLFYCIIYVCRMYMYVIYFCRQRELVTIPFAGGNCRRFTGGCSSWNNSDSTLDARKATHTATGA
jgi:hypothetical protein